MNLRNKKPSEQRHGTLSVGCLSPYGLMKTPREMGAAYTTH